MAVVVFQDNAVTPTQAGELWAAAGILDAGDPGHTVGLSGDSVWVPADGAPTAVGFAGQWFDASAVVEAIRVEVSDRRPLVLLYPPGERWKGLAAALSAAFRGEYYSGVTAVQRQGEQWTVELAVYGGLVAATIDGQSTVLSLSPAPGRFAGRPVVRRGVDRVRELPAAASQWGPLPAPAQPALAEARVIVAGGRGLGGAEGFTLLEAVAQRLGGEVGASRAAVDAGWIAGSRQIGQTGATVAPELYLAIGISGASQHLAGMQRARRVVCINPDARAPMAAHADLVVEGDYRSVLTGFLRALAAEQEGEA